MSPSSPKSPHLMVIHLSAVFNNIIVVSSTKTRKNAQCWYIFAISVFISCLLLWIRFLAGHTSSRCILPHFWWKELQSKLGTFLFVLTAIYFYQVDQPCSQQCFPKLFSPLGPNFFLKIKGFRYHHFQ